MPVYVQDPEIAASTLVEELGAIIADICNGIEIRLQQDLARRIRHAMDVYPELPERLRAITELQQLAADQIARYAPPQLAEELIRLAAEAGTAAAVTRLALAPRLPRSLGLTPSSVNAAAMLALDLRNRFEDVNRRILRYPDDAYKEIVARLAPDMLVGGQSLALTQRRIIQNFLREGVTGFVDVSGRRWRIGSYTEMATRTATMRAWQDAGLARMVSSGITLVDVVVGRTACKHCRRGRACELGEHATTTPTVGAHHRQSDGRGYRPCDRAAIASTGTSTTATAPTSTRVQPNSGESMATFTKPSTTATMATTAAATSPMFKRWFDRAGVRGDSVTSRAYPFTAVSLGSLSVSYVRCRTIPP